MFSIRLLSSFLHRCWTSFTLASSNARRTASPHTWNVGPCRKCLYPLATHHWIRNLPPPSNLSHSWMSWTGTFLYISQFNQSTCIYQNQKCKHFCDENLGLEIPRILDYCISLVVVELRTCKGKFYQEAHGLHCSLPRATNADGQINTVWNCKLGWRHNQVTMTSQLNYDNVTANLWWRHIEKLQWRHNQELWRIARIVAMETATVAMVIF